MGFVSENNIWINCRTSMECCAHNSLYLYSRLTNRVFMCIGYFWKNCLNGKNRLGWDRYCVKCSISHVMKFAKFSDIFEKKNNCTFFTLYLNRTGRVISPSKSSIWKSFTHTHSYHWLSTKTTGSNRLNVWIRYLTCIIIIRSLLRLDERHG